MAVVAVVAAALGCAGSSSVAICDGICTSFVQVQSAS
jgi:hypothetical protein